MTDKEDASVALDNFFNDVANLPAEIAHLYEEMNAKQDLINDLNAKIARKDGEIQHWVKVHGALKPHPHEAKLSNEIRDCYDKAQLLQQDKIGFANKACTLMDRYVRRLDVKIRDLQQDGTMNIDPSMPTLLRDSPGNLVPISTTSGRTTGANTPLQPLSTNVLTGSTMAHVAAFNRLAAANNLNRNQAASVPHQIHHSSPAVTSQRESSLGPDTKRRRLNASLGPGAIAAANAMPITTRHSSLGPGTPRALTPSGSRAGSVGPAGRPGLIKKASTLKKGAPLAQQLARGASGGPSRRLGGKLKKGGRRGAGRGGSPSTTTTTGSASDTDSDESSSAYTSSAAPGTQPAEGSRRHGPPNDADADVDEASDDTKYCYCHDVSHGDMIACDNADCKIQWFHWTCANITSEPQGEWLCRECRKLPRDKIRKQ